MNPRGGRLLGPARQRPLGTELFRATASVLAWWCGFARFGKSRAAEILYASPRNDTQPTTLGAFSVSLSVKDLQASKAFYETLDFEVVMGTQQRTG